MVLSSATSKRFEQLTLSDVPVETEIADITDLSTASISLMQSIARIQDTDQSNDDTDGGDDDENEDSGDEESGGSGSVTTTGTGSILGTTNFAGQGAQGSGGQGEEEGAVGVEIDTYAEEVYL